MGILVAALAAGCADMYAPMDELRQSQASLSLAVDAGAADLSPRELALAREKLELAQHWIAANDYKPARWLLEQARVDAELATVRAASARARQPAR